MISTIYCKSYLIKAQQEGASRCAPTEITILIVAQKFYDDGSSFITVRINLTPLRREGEKSQYYALKECKKVPHT
jgi:hypothetical protein